MKADSISSFASRLGASLKSAIKMAAYSKPCRIQRVSADEGARPMVVMGNGPSLADTMRDHGEALRRYPSMAVNFAANADEFVSLHPRYYILADPHLFTQDDANVARLWANLSEKVTWPMTLLVPASRRKEAMQAVCGNPRVTVEGFNPVGVEGFAWLEDMAYSRGLGMPRPRNVLIPAIMAAMQLGYKEIYIVGADHSWMRTLSVDEQNRVVSVQPHFYKDNDSERERVTAVYSDVRLHDIISSFYVAFRAYHRIADYARRHGISIINATPGSFIDAFPRQPLPA